MMARLSAMCAEARTNGTHLPDSADMLGDDVLGSLIKELWDPILTLQIRVAIAMGWWVGMARDGSIDQNVLDEALPVPSFAIGQEARGTIIDGVSADGPEKVQELLWAVFLWRTWRAGEKAMPRAWSAVKSAAAGRSPKSEARYKACVWGSVPSMLTGLIAHSSDLTDDQKADSWVRFDMALPEEDSRQFERVHARQHPSFKK